MASLYLVDDHPVLREAMTGLLATYGHVVVGQSEDPSVASAEVRRLRPDLVLLDIKLGVRSGFEMLNNLVQRPDRPRVIVATMSERAQDIAEARRLGADGYVLKGSHAAEWARAIDQVLAGRPYYEGRVAELASQAPRAGNDQAALDSLSVRERQVIVMVVNGLSSAAIGDQLHLSPKTVDTYRSRLMQKVGARDVQGLVRYALRSGLIQAEDL